jgi:hypothetical protein
MKLAQNQKIQQNLSVPEFFVDWTLWSFILNISVTELLKRSFRENFLNLFSILLDLIQFHIEHDSKLIPIQMFIENVFFDWNSKFSHSIDSNSSVQFMLDLSTIITTSLSTMKDKWYTRKPLRLSLTFQDKVWASYQIFPDKSSCSYLFLASDKVSMITNYWSNTLQERKRYEIACWSSTKGRNGEFLLTQRHSGIVFSCEIRKITQLSFKNGLHSKETNFRDWNFKNRPPKDNWIKIELPTKK